MTFAQLSAILEPVNFQMKKIFFKLCIELNPMISIGSDAHNITELGMSLDLLLKTIQ